MLLKHVLGFFNHLFETLFKTGVTFFKHANLRFKWKIHSGLTPNGISTVKAAFIFQLGEELDNAVILFCLAGHVDERQEFLDTHEHSVRWMIN